MWTIQNYEDVGRRQKKFEKKWPHELKNVFENLATLLLALNGGTKPEQLKQMRFVHSEPAGVLAIDQKGPSKRARMKQFRLYVFPDEEHEVLHTITLGDKGRQQSDVNFCIGSVKQLQGEIENGKTG